MDGAWSSGTKKEEVKYPMVVIRWEDTIHDAGWDEDINHCPVFSSVGWLISGDEQPIRIANTIAADGTPAGILAVPIGCLVDVTAAEAYEHTIKSQDDI